MRASLGRDPWQDRFNTPSAGALVSAIAAPQRQLFDSARAGLVALDLTEQLGWRGLPWRWAFSYALPAAEDPSTLAIAFLVPKPERPSLAIPLDAATIRELPLRRMSKGVRDTLAHAANVGGVLWPEWELTSPNQATELVDLARRRLDLLRPAAAAG